MTGPVVQERWVTLTAGAIELRRSREATLRLVTAGKIRADKVDGQWRLRLADVLALAEQLAAPAGGGQ